MRVNAIAMAMALPVLILGGATAPAADRPDVKGLYLLTDYPTVSVRPGTTSTLSLRLQNYGLPPENFALSVDGAPAGWTATLLGGGQPVGAAMPATDQSVSLQLRLDVPADTDMSAKTLTVKAEGQGAGDEPGHKLALPLGINLAKELPAKLTLTPSLPSLRGTPKSSFDFTVAVKNDSGRNLTVNLAASAPRNFETSFTESYGSQELTSVPIDAGSSKDIKLKVRPPYSVDAGSFPVRMTATSGDATATTDLGLEVIGQPRLTISGPEGRISAGAAAGEQRQVAVMITNDGTAAANDVELSGSPPPRSNGWKIEFDKKTVERIAPGQTVAVNALITPAEKAVAGRYMPTLRAASRNGNESASAEFVIDVSTSTVWAYSGVALIALALALMFGAVLRFGRR
jgi:uncharacterized membrane protein